MFGRRKFNKRGFVIFLPLVACVGFWLFEQYHFHHRLNTEGVETTGYVVSVNNQFRRPRVYVTHIQYRFVVDGVTYYDTTTAQTDEARALFARRPVQVRYVPDDPTISAIVVNQTSTNWPPIILIALTFTAAIGISLSILAVSLFMRRVR